MPLYPFRKILVFKRGKQTVAAYRQLLSRPLLAVALPLTAALLLLAWLLPVGRQAPPAPSQPVTGWQRESLPQTSAAAVALIEAHSGRVLLSVRGEEPLPPASTTKIVTALVALDLQPNLDQACLISEAAAGVGESSVYLQAGETLPLSELLRGMLIHSGNDASWAVAEAIAGSEAWFVHWMEMKSLALACYRCDFANTSGLPAENHQTSALDMAYLTAAGLELPFFAETVASKYTSLGQGAGYRYFRNTNKLLWLDEAVIGVKTGTTDAAGPCLVSGYEQGAARYVCVVFNSFDRYGESLALLRWAAANHTLLRLAQQGQVLACLPQEQGWLRLAAVGDLDVLVANSQRDALTARWRLPDEEGRYWLEILSGGIHSRQLLHRVELLPVS